ncbi:MAG: tetratricopeptide repeat protein [Alphaproteobacteria bacterium]|nr:tetratricopeptide repeat protein [Alphaproteobacteria bacterium]
MRFFFSILLASVSLAGIAQASTSGAYLAARFAQDQGDWSATHKYIKEIMRDPDVGEAVQRRALVVAIAAEDYNQADLLADALLKTEEDKTLPLFYHAIRAVDAGENEKALKTLEEIPDGGLAEISRPLLYTWLGPLDVRKTPKVSTLVLYHKILKAELDGKKDEIAMLAAQLPTDWPLSIRARNRLDAALLRNDLKDVAQKYDSTLADISNQNQILSTFKPVQSVKEGVGFALFDIASMLYNEQSAESTFIFLKLALMAETEIPEAHLLLATIEATRGRVSEAIAELKKIPSEYGLKEFVDIQRNIATLMFEAGAEREGVAILRDLGETHHDVDSLINLGDYFRNTERFEEALQCYEAAFRYFLDAVPQDYWYLYYYRGMTLERLGNWKRAEKDLLKALQFKPDDPQILNYIGYSWADKGNNLDKAVSYLQRAVQLRPDDGYILDSLGWVYYRMKEWDKAVLWLEKAAQLMPYDATINDHLGDAYWKTGRKIEARFQWQRAMDNKPEEEAVPTIEEKLAAGLK